MTWVHDFVVSHAIGKFAYVTVNVPGIKLSEEPQSVNVIERIFIGKWIVDGFLKSGNRVGFRSQPRKRDRSRLGNIHVLIV